MYDVYIYASYGVTAVLLGGFVSVSLRQLSVARAQIMALDAHIAKAEKKKADA